jgi:hypothetical protein
VLYVFFRTRFDEACTDPRYFCVLTLAFSGLRRFGAGHAWRCYSCVIPAIYYVQFSPFRNVICNPCMFAFGTAHFW